MTLSSLSNQVLISRFLVLRDREKSELIQILRHIREMDRRKIFVTMGHTSLYNYLVKEFQYSEHEAYSRIEAARLLEKLPECEVLLRTGRLTLSTITEARSAIRQEEVRSGQPMDTETQREVLESIDGCSRREAQAKLTQRFEKFKPGGKERLVQTRDGGWILELIFNREQRITIEKARDILANSSPFNGYSGIVSRLAEHYLNKRDLTRRFAAGGETAHQEKSVPPRGSRKISLSLRRAIFHRDEGKCQFKNSDGGLCGNTYKIVVDHIIPVSAGGTSTYQNLRCLCRVHNQWKADRTKPE